MGIKDLFKDISHAVKHDFGDWKYIEEGSCKMERSCTYCGFTERKIKHPYNEQICSRCDEVLDGHMNA